MERKLPKPRSGFPTTLIYQPADRYWIFQAIEFGIAFGRAIAVLSRRRLADPWSAGNRPGTPAADALGPGDTHTATQVSSASCLGES